MVDFARITVRAGDGGDGAGSFHKIKGKRYGKADGGPGGNGGNVYIEASADLSTLETYRYVKDYKAQSGQAGSSFRKRGAGGEDLVLKVPVGTQIKVSNVKEELKEPSILYDLVEEGQRVLVTRGGIGGRGNSQLKDEFGRRPKVGEKGEAGERVNVTLELKLIADVGLIGLPNAGKSTLLAELTRAKPEIADYPFTTLEPNLGVLDAEGKRLVIADIPGLIEGASRGKGLGDLFLRHIERTRVLVHLIDISGSGYQVSGTSFQVSVKSRTETRKPEPGTWNSSNSSSSSNLSDLGIEDLSDLGVEDLSLRAEGLQTEKFWQDYQTVRTELKKYSKELVRKPEIVVLSKIDLVSTEDLKKARDVFSSHRKKVLAISCKTGEGLGELQKTLFNTLEKAKQRIEKE